MKRLGEFSWVEVCKESLLNEAYSMDYGTFPVYFWNYVTALRGCDLVDYIDRDSIYLKQAIAVRNICKKYITALLRGKKIGRRHFDCWEEITETEIKRLKEIIMDLTKISFLVFEYFGHYFFHVRVGFLALSKVFKDERYKKLGEIFFQEEDLTYKDMLIKYLETLAQMLEEELKGGEK